MSTLSVRLLQMVGEDLLLLVDPIAGNPFQPSREALMERGADVFGLSS